MKFRLTPFYDADDGLNVGGSEEMMEVAEPRKTDADAKFAEMRRQNEEQARRIAELESANSLYDETLGLFFDGDDKIAKARAHYNETDVDTEIEEINRENDRARFEEERKAFEQERSNFEFERRKLEDKKELSKAGITVGDVSELGDSYFRYRANGCSPIEAYNIIEAHKPKEAKTTGTIKTERTKKDYFTRDEVINMSKKEIHDNYEAILASQKSW